VKMDTLAWQRYLNYNEITETSTGKGEKNSGYHFIRKVPVVPCTWLRQKRHSISGKAHGA